MRIRLKNPQLFFQDILKNRKMNLKEISLNDKISYSALKNFARGDSTIPENIFFSLLAQSSKKEEPLVIERLENNWGAIKGGQSSAKKKDIKKRMIYVRRFKKITKVNIKLNKLFCEFYGALLGDGCITRYKDDRGFEKFQIILTCNKKLDSEYLQSWKEKLLKEYNLYTYYHEIENKNVCQLTIRNKNFSLELNRRFAVPIGIKYDQLTISKKILKLPWEKKKFAIRGLLDTDGLIFARKDENYRYPHIAITSKNKDFLNQIKDLLRKRNYPAYINGIDIRIKGVENIKRWFEDIGSSNKRNLERYKYFLKHGNLPPRSSGLWCNG